MSSAPPPSPVNAASDATLRLGPIRCTAEQLTDLMTQWDCTPTECEVLVRVLMLESPKRIAAERGRTVDHIRNVINSIVHKARSTDGVPGVIMRAAAILMPDDPPTSLDAIHRIIARAQQQRQGPAAAVGRV